MRGRGQPVGLDHLDDELLSRLVDGDPSPEERRLADTHLATCSGCEARLDALRSTVALLQGLPSPSPARSFQLATSHARSTSGWRRFSTWLPAGLPALRAAVVAVVLVVGGAAAFAAIQDDEDLSGRSTGDIEAESTVSLADGDGAPTLVPTVPDAVIEQTQAKTSVATTTPDTSVSRSGQEVEAAEIATSTPAPTSTSRPLPTATLARDAIFGIDDGAESDAAGDALPASTETAPAGVDESSDEISSEVSSDSAVSDADGEAPAAEAPSDNEADQVAPESSAAFAAATPTAAATVTASPSPTRRPTVRPSTPSTNPVASPIASPLASPIASPVASPMASPSAMAIPIEGDSVDGMSNRRIDEMLALAILLMVGGIVVAVRATRGVPR